MLSSQELEDEMEESIFQSSHFHEMEYNDEDKDEYLDELVEEAPTEMIYHHLTQDLRRYLPYDSCLDLRYWSKSTYQKSRVDIIRVLALPSFSFVTSLQLTIKLSSELPVVKETISILPRSSLKDLSLYFWDDPSKMSTTEIWRMLARTLPSTGLTHLWISNLEIDYKGFKLFSSALPRSRLRLISLGGSKNQIENQHLRILAGTLRNSSLTCLALTLNHAIDEKIVKMLFKQLPFTCLDHLELVISRSLLVHVYDIAIPILSRTHLTRFGCYLDMGGYQMSQPNKTISNICDYNRSLQELCWGLTNHPGLRKAVVQKLPPILIKIAIDKGWIRYHQQYHSFLFR